MKKIILLLAVIFAVNSMQAQTYPPYGWYVEGDNDTLNHRDYESQYLLTEPFLNNCATLDIFNYYHTGSIDYSYVLNRNTLFMHNLNTYWFDFAQPYYSDTIIKIVGISFYGYATRCGYNPNYCLIDTAVFLEVQDEQFANSYVCVPTSLPMGYKDENNNILNEIPQYTEVFFEEPILIKGNFNLVASTIENLNSDYITVFAVNNNCPTTQQLPLRKRHDKDYWEEIIYDGYYTTPKKAQSLYLFPILGEKEEGDTIPIGLNEINNLENFVKISPNPTDKHTVIKSKYKINTIEVYNSIGQLLETKEVNNYSYQIDVSNYNSGHYVLKITTSNGICNKQLIVK